jgi:hypothetical protein
MPNVSCKIADLDEGEIDFAVGLLVRFFVEEGFPGTRETIALNSRGIWADPNHWIALAWVDGVAVGVVTVTTMLYVEWDRSAKSVIFMCSLRRETRGSGQPS